MTGAHLWVHALPRLLAASWLAGIAATLAIRWTFRPGKSHLWWAPPGPVTRRRLK